MNRVLARTERSLHLEAIEGDLRALYTVTRTARDGTQKLWFLLNTGGEEIRLAASL